MGQLTGLMYMLAGVTTHESQYSVMTDFNTFEAFYFSNPNYEIKNKSLRCIDRNNFTIVSLCTAATYIESEII